MTDPRRQGVGVPQHHPKGWGTAPRGRVLTDMRPCNARAGLLRLGTGVTP